MLKYLEPLDWLPTAEELPDSDERPVDNELQDLVPSLLKLILASLWEDRSNWFFGVDMGIYFNPDEPPIVPDGFLSLGVDRIKDENLRLSYVLWEEQGILPQLVLEVVSKQYRGEYTTKKDFYQQLGVLYYVVYNSRRRRKPSLEVYKLIQGQYIPMVGNPIWFPELEIGLGKERRSYQGIEREWLFWYNQAGVRYLTPQERADQEQQRANQEQQRANQEQQRANTAEALAQKLADRLRSLGVDPEET